jgi:holo-[acyl-carrier protein] synthase
MDRAAVIQVLSRISRKPAAEILDHVSLASLGLSTSLGLSLLRTNLESAGGGRLSPLAPQLQVGGLVALVDGARTERPAIASPGTGPAPTALIVAASPAERIDTEWALGLGIDLQDVESMPVTSDYRAHEFYRTHFDPTELATAALRADPRLHLCGVFCAKEAAKKSHPDLLDLRMEELCVTHAVSGGPLLVVKSASLAQRFRFTLSITHTRGFAMAACITRWKPV